MSKWFSAIAFAALLVTPAQSLEIFFNGGATLLSKSAGCPGFLSVGNRYEIFYFFPISGTTNGTSSTISLFSLPGADAFQLNNGTFNTTFKNVTAFHIFSRAGSYPAQIKMVQQSPASVTTTTRFLNFRFQINKFDDNPSCLLTFDASGVRTPN